MSLSRAVALALLALVGLLPTTAQAQARLTGADLSGAVVDASGAVLPGVTVTVTHRETNQARTLATDERGRYVAPALPPGTYRVTVHLEGFADQTREGLTLVLGQAAQIDFRMAVAGQQESVTVVDEAPLVEVARTAISSVVGQQQIENLPINGRSYIGFAIITPGASPDRTPLSLGGVTNTTGVSVTGQRARSNNIMVDGLDNNDQVVGSVRPTFSQEAVREFQVIANSYSAEFGKAAGGIVNIVTRSGTNDWSGNAFLYFRNDTLNSREPFERFNAYDLHGHPVGAALDREKAPFSQYQWGATLGGPLRKDKTFFFLSFERFDARANNFVTIAPETAILLRSRGFPVEIGNVPYDNELTTVFGKTDHHWNPDHSLVARANYGKTRNENAGPWGGLVARSAGGVQLRDDWAFSVAETDILSRRWVSEARVQVARQDVRNQSLDPTCNGECDSYLEGSPSVGITGYAQVGVVLTLPQPRKNDRFQLMETVSFFQGNHTAKAGIEHNRFYERVAVLPLYFRGFYTFQALPAIPALGIPLPLTALQAFERGIPVVDIQGYGNPSRPSNYQDLSVFVQDDWRITPRLTLKAGLRYQRQFWRELSYDVSSVGGTRLRYDLPEDRNDFAPRLAVAFDLTGDGKTSLHAAYGLFHDNNLPGLIDTTAIVDGHDFVRFRALVSPADLLALRQAWTSPGRIPPEPAGDYPSTALTLDPRFQTPYAHQAAIGVERSLGQDLAVSLNYLHVRGKFQPGQIDYNRVTPALGVGRRPNDLPCTTGTAGCVNGGRVGSSQGVTQYTFYADTWYDGVTVALSKRPRHNHQYQLSYTFSKALDNVTDYNGQPTHVGRGRNPDDPYGLPLGFDRYDEKGLATHDLRHRFVGSGFYRLPADFQLSAIVTAASGWPFTVTAGADLDGDGTADRARLVPTDAATELGRNTEHARASVQVDARLSKRVKLGGGAAVEAIFEVFNLFDRANFIDVNPVFGRGAFPDQPQATYGQYTRSLPGRQIQLAAKVSF